MNKIINTLIFVYLSSIILVFASEITYWYAGNIIDYLLLAVFYSLPTYFFLWSIQKFNINDILGLFLAGSLYGFLVEGMLASVLYEDGLLGWFHISYTSISWHAIISVILVWYYFRKLMINKKIVSLIVWSSLYGIMWGVWTVISISLNEQKVLTIFQFFLYSSLSFLLFIISYWTINKFWMKSLKFNNITNIIFIIGLLFFFINPISIYYYAPIKLFLVLGVTFTLLYIYKIKNNNDKNIFNSLNVNIPIYRKLPLFLIPIFGFISYSLIILTKPNFKELSEIAELIAFCQGVIGWIVFIIIVILIIIKKNKINKVSLQ